MSSVDLIALFRDDIGPAMWDSLRPIAPLAIGVFVGPLVLKRGWQLFKSSSDSMLQSGQIAGWSEGADELRRRESREARDAAEQAKWDRMRKRLGT